jgi:hypothetical protein
MTFKPWIMFEEEATLVEVVWLKPFSTLSGYPPAKAGGN